jgi:hypothetical protein
MKPVLFRALVLLAVMLAACTFIYVQGDGNRFNDTGGDITSRLGHMRGSSQPASETWPSLLHH